MSVRSVSILDLATLTGFKTSQIPVTAERNVGPLRRKNLVRKEHILRSFRKGSSFGPLGSGRKEPACQSLTEKWKLIAISWKQDSYGCVARSERVECLDSLAVS